MTATVNLAPLAKQRFVDNNGLPLVGGKLFTYAAGTTTKQATYTDSTASGFNTNPVILDSRGEAAIWTDETLTYKFVAAPYNDTDPPTNPFWTVDGIAGGSGLFEFGASLASSSGPGKVGFDPTLNYASATLGAHVAQEFWNPRDFPWLAKGDDSTYDTSAVQACVNAAAAAGAGVYIPAGTYLVNSVSLPSNTQIRGAGIGKTILKQISGANDLWHTADPGSATTFTSNVTISDLTLQGTVATDGFQEVLHLMFLQGASDVTIQRVKFSGMRGDGLYVGTGNERGQNPSQVRHNRSIRVLDCIFDGEVKANRNAISFVDCDGAWVERCYFTRLSQQGMPGPIDIEPDSGGTPSGTSSVIRNINVVRNMFRDNAGNATISVNFPNALSAYATQPYGINIIVNDVDNGASFATATYGTGISINGTAQVTRAVAELGITLRENTINNVYSPFFIRAVRGIDVIQNRFGNSKYSAEIGDSSGSAFNTFDVRFDGNELYQVASDTTVGGNGIFLYAGDAISFRKNIFDSCGKSDNSYNANITLSTTGTKSYITVEDNFFLAPVANSSAWDVRRDGGVLSAGTTRHARNRYLNVNGGTVNFSNDYITPDDYQSPAMANSWVASTSAGQQAPQFWKDEAGIVHLRGSTQGGTTTTGSTIMNIPAGFRPGKTLPFVVYTSSGLGSVQVENTQGDLQVLSLPGNALVSLNGISWKAEV